jgi:hypothetical protein
MGLTVHYQLSLPRNVRGSASRLVQSLHAKAAKSHPGRTGVRVFPPTTDAVELNRWACAFFTYADPDDPETVHGVSVPPIEGCVFPVSIGQDCEVLWLGLCRYPATIQNGGRILPTAHGAGWQFSGACKTQYASVHGWDHFRRCHTTVVGLLRVAAGTGIRVRITDEGGWWPHRSDPALRRALEKNNQIVAAIGGALKDQFPDGEARVASSIFAHPDFERLEAEGVARLSKSGG